MTLLLRHGKILSFKYSKKNIMAIYAYYIAMFPKWLCNLRTPYKITTYQIYLNENRTVMPWGKVKVPQDKLIYNGCETGMPTMEATRKR